MYGEKLGRERAKKKARERERGDVYVFFLCVIEKTDVSAGVLMYMHVYVRIFMDR